MSDTAKKHGFAAVPANPETVFQDVNLQGKGSPVAIAVSETPTPATPLARRVDGYCRQKLPKPVYLHSLRVYHLGLAMKRYVAPDWEFSDETYFLACLLHDLGGTLENLRATLLSHEFFAGFLALDLLQKDSAGGNAVASKPQAESVAEAIIRHQNLCQTGNLTAMGQILQLATIFDNTGAHSHLLHDDTIQDVIKHYPRTGWSSCFASVVRDEITLKPWAHTTVIGGFGEKILANPYSKYD